MKWQGLALLVLGLVTGSCAIDGGSSGTGISTTTAGNVATVIAAASPAAMPRGGMPSGGTAGTSLAGIRVTIAGTDVADETDAQGGFALRGDYDSIVTVRFERAADALRASLEVNVPAGGTLTLSDVVLDASRGSALPATQDVLFDGTITAIDCAAGELDLVSTQRPDDGDVYVVRLAGSSITDQAGTPVACAALAPGQTATVDGSVLGDGSFGDATIVLDGDGS